MTPDEAIAQAKSGEIAPIYLLVGEEAYAAEQVVAAFREAVLTGGFAPFNEERLVAGEVDVGRVIAAARTLPMMAKRKLILVRSLDRWESRSTDADAPARPEADGGRVSPLDLLGEYASAPVASTCLVLVGVKIDGRRKLMTQARKGGWLVSCDPIPRGALPSFVVREARSRGHAIDSETADLLAEISGPDLSSVADALERLSLYVGTGQSITEDAIAACLIRVRQTTVWELINAVGRRDLGPALAALQDVYDPRDRGLRLIGLLAWSFRQLIKFDAASRAGAAPEEAARQAGAPPFKARELAAQVRRLPRRELERWLLLLAEADLELKGSKRPPRATLEDAIMQMCRGTAAAG
ncbi:MAG TPA: DNA polymerase III subunit delta [Polyangiaceae bacterium]